MTGSITPPTPFWRGKRVLLTGHTGFKGGWLAIWLHRLGAQVTGIALPPCTEPSLYRAARIGDLVDSRYCDIRDAAALREQVVAVRPDIVLHLAAQALVRPSYAQPVETFATNIMGTAHLLDALRATPSAKVAVMVTTDKVYRNNEWPHPYRENDTLGGHDPYSNSKGCVELITSAYRNSFFHGEHAVALASARAGNVIGGGDWADDRLIPDILRAVEQSKPVVVRNPKATRPWQHVLEPLSGYLVLAQHLWEHGHAVAQGWNFGPRDEDARPVEWILDHMVQAWGDGASWQLDNDPQPHEARYLKLDISKARAHLKWEPTWSLETTLTRIVHWHRAWLQGDDMHERCVEEINSYMAAMATGA